MSATEHLRQARELINAYSEGIVAPWTYREFAFRLEQHFQTAMENRSHWPESDEIAVAEHEAIKALGALADAIRRAEDATERLFIAMTKLEA